jgi:mannose-6-phosphate isomerase-like protein (cupin superfamily)
VHPAGRCLIGDRVYELREHDLVHIPALTWHQFRATTTRRSDSCAW